MDNIQKDILTKRFQTTMIGALFAFEQTFGYLWGQHKENESDLTDSEIDFWDKWDLVRNQILNNGNAQLRKAISDLDKASGQCRYHYTFHSKKEDQK